MRNAPLRLNHEWPRMVAGQRELVEQRLSFGCYCGGETANLTRRITRSATVVVSLQCTSCGSSIGGQMSRKDHFSFQDYLAWDTALVDRIAQEREAQRTDTIAQYAADNALIQQRAEARYSDYQEFLRTPEWRELRRRVMARASHSCEACLDAGATDVHHIDYQQGRLPPAWMLRAVCRACHDRLHNISHSEEWA
jgi:hypothetical protein